MAVRHKQSNGKPGTHDKGGAPPQVREFKIENRYGLHAKPAALFVKITTIFDSDIVVEKEGKKASGKSIMGLLVLEASCGSVLKVTATGWDAEEMLDELQHLVDAKFDEP